jgi:hypothetical protein
MDIVSGISIFFFINRLIQQGHLIKFSICGERNILLPVELLEFNPIIVKWEVIKITFLLLNNFLSDLFLDSQFLTLRVYQVRVHFIKQVIKIDQDKVHCPFEDYLFLFDGSVHEISSIKDANLWSKVFFSDLFHKAPKLIDFDSFSSRNLAIKWFLDSSVLKYYFT